MNQPLLDAALQAHDNGLTTIPIHPAQGEESKKPAVPWKTYQTQKPSRTQIQQWFINPNHGIGVICGKTSGNLIMIELEGEANHQYNNLQQLAHNSGLGHLWDRATNGWLEASPNGGFHFYLTHDGNPQGNQKLARRPSTPQELKTWKQEETHKAQNLPEPQQTRRLERINNTQPHQVPVVLSETRGEGGYSVVAPTPGTHHETGRAWVSLTPNLYQPAHLTSQELADFLTLFETLDQMPPPPARPAAPISNHPAGTGLSNRLKPGDDYEQKTSWADILTPEGWTPLFTQGSTTYWRRPGKDHGISATTGHADDKNRLYVFTTSTTFEDRKPYSKFAAYTHLHHAGNYTEAAKTLAKNGYGEQDVTTQVENDFPANLRPIDQLHTIPGGQTTTQTQGTSALQPKLHNATINLKELNDTTNATYFVDTCKDLIRHIADEDTWAHWNGHKWERLPNNAAPIIQLAQQAFQTLKKTDQSLEKWCNKSLNRAPLKNTLTLAATDPRVTTTSNQYDQHHEELNTPEGTINLRTSQLSPNDPTKLHSKSTTTTPNPNCPTPKWEQFLADTFAGHPGMTEYVQQLAGYAATGLVTAQILPFLYGAGANGKSVFVDVITKLLGDYAAAAPPGFLTQQQQQHSTEMAMLNGVRFTTASEVAEGSKFDEVKIKQLTGGDQITARRMREDFSTFQPTHKIWVTGNHQPKVTSGGYSFWRRLRLVPFTNTIPEKNQNVYLARELVEEEGPGILAWITHGSQIFLQSGFTEPSEVTQATKAYEESEDELGRFIADRVIIGAGEHSRVPYKEMRAAYTEWCSLEGLTPTTANMFTREMKSRFNISTGRTKQGRFYTGALLADIEPENDYEKNDSWNDLGGGF